MANETQSYQTAKASVDKMRIAARIMAGKNIEGAIAACQAIEGIDVVSHRETQAQISCWVVNVTRFKGMLTRVWFNRQFMPDVPLNKYIPLAPGLSIHLHHT